MSVAMATSLKDAIKLFEGTEEAKGQPASECEMVRICPIALSQ